MPNDVFRTKTPFTNNGTVRRFIEQDPIVDTTVNKSISDDQAIINDQLRAWEATKFYGIPRYDNDGDNFDIFHVVEVEPTTGLVTEYAEDTTKVCALTVSTNFDESFTSLDNSSTCHRYQRVAFVSTYIVVDPTKLDPAGLAVDLTVLGFSDEDLLSYESGTGFLVLAQNSSNAIVARVIDASDNVIQFFGKTLLDVGGCKENYLKNSNFEKVQDMTRMPDGSYLERQILRWDNDLQASVNVEERGTLLPADLLAYDQYGAPVGKYQPFPWLLYTRNWRINQFEDIQYIYNADPTDPQGLEPFIFHRNMAFLIHTLRDAAFVPPFGALYGTGLRRTIAKVWNPFVVDDGKDANVLGRNAFYPAQDRRSVTMAFICKVKLPYPEDFTFAFFPPGTSVGDRRTDSDTKDVYEWNGIIWVAIGNPYTNNTRVEITYGFGYKEQLVGDPFTGSQTQVIDVNELDSARRAGGWAAFPLSFQAPIKSWIVPMLETFVEPTDDLDLYVGGVKEECGTRYTGYIEWQEEICAHFLTKYVTCSPFGCAPCMPDTLEFVAESAAATTIEGDVRHTMFQQVTGGEEPITILEDLRTKNNFFVRFLNTIFGTKLESDANPRVNYYVVQDPEGRRSNAPISGPLGQGSIEMEPGDAVGTNFVYYDISRAYGTKNPFFYSIGNPTETAFHETFSVLSDEAETMRGSFAIPVSSGTVAVQAQGTFGVGPLWDSASYPYYVKTYYTNTEDFIDFEVPARPLVVKDGNISIVIDETVAGGVNYQTVGLSYGSIALFKSTTDGFVYRIAPLFVASGQFAGYIDMDSSKGRIWMRGTSPTATTTWTPASDATEFPALGSVGGVVINAGAMPASFKRFATDIRSIFYDIRSTRSRLTPFSGAVIDLTDQTTDHKAAGSVSGTMTFSGVLAAPVTRNSFLANLDVDGGVAIVLRDNGNGNFYIVSGAAVIDTGLSSINYATGAYTVTFTVNVIDLGGSPLGNDVDVYAATRLITRQDDAGYLDYFDSWFKDADGAGLTPGGVTPDSGKELGMWFTWYAEYGSFDDAAAHPNTALQSDTSGFGNAKHPSNAAGHFGLDIQTPAAGNATDWVTQGGPIAGRFRESPAEYVDEEGGSLFRFDQADLYYRRVELDDAFTAGFLDPVTDNPSSVLVTALYPTGAFPMFHKRWLEEDGVSLFRKAVRVAQVGDVFAANPLTFGSMGGFYNLPGGLGGSLNWDITGTAVNNIVVQATVDSRDILLQIKEQEFSSGSFRYGLPDEDVTVLEVVESAAVGVSIKTDLQWVIQRAGFGDMLVFSVAPVNDFIVVYTTHRNHDWIDDEYYIQDRATAYPAGPNFGLTATTGSVRFDKVNSYINLWTGVVKDVWNSRDGVGNRVILDVTDARHVFAGLVDTYTGPSGGGAWAVGATDFFYHNFSSFIGIIGSTIANSYWAARKDSFAFDFCSTIIESPSYPIGSVGVDTRFVAPLPHWELTTSEHPLVVTAPYQDGNHALDPNGGTPTGKYYSGLGIFDAASFNATLIGGGTANNNTAEDLVVYPEGGFFYAEAVEDAGLDGGVYSTRDQVNAQLMSAQKAFGRHVTYQLACDPGSRDFSLYYLFKSAPSSPCASEDYTPWIDLSASALAQPAVKTTRTLSFTLTRLLNPTWPVGPVDGAVAEAALDFDITGADAGLAKYLGASSNNHQILGVKLDPPVLTGARKNPMVIGSVKLRFNLGAGMVTVATDRISNASGSNPDLFPAAWINGSEIPVLEFFNMNGDTRAVTLGQNALTPIDINDNDDGDNPFGIGFVRYEAGGQYLFFTIQDAGFFTNSARADGAATFDLTSVATIPVEIEYEYYDPVVIDVPVAAMSQVNVGDHLLVNPWARLLKNNSLGAIPVNFRTEILPDSFFNGVEYTLFYPQNHANPGAPLKVKWTEAGVPKSATLSFQAPSYREIRVIRRDTAPFDNVALSDVTRGIVKAIPSAILADAGSGSVEYYLDTRSEFVEVLTKDTINNTITVSRGAHPQAYQTSSNDTFAQFAYRHPVNYADVDFSLLTTNPLATNFNKNQLQCVLIKHIKYTVLDPNSDYAYLSPGPGGGEELNVQPYIIGNAATPPEPGTAVNALMDGAVTLFDLAPATAVTEYDTRVDATSAQLYDLPSIYDFVNHIWVMGLDVSAGGQFNLKLAELTMPAITPLSVRDLSHDTEARFGGTLSVPPTQGDGGQISKFFGTNETVLIHSTGMETTTGGAPRAYFKVYRQTGLVWTDVTAVVPGAVELPAPASGNWFVPVDNTFAAHAYKTQDTIMDLTTALIPIAVNEIKIDLMVDSDFRTDDDGAPQINGIVGSVYATIDLSVPAAPFLWTDIGGGNFKLEAVPAGDVPEVLSVEFQP